MLVSTSASSFGFVGVAVHRRIGIAPGAERLEGDESVALVVADDIEGANDGCQVH